MMHSLHLGDVVAQRYTLVGVLGEGGFATVFDARDRSSRRVAVKVLKPVATSLRDEQAARFAREVQVLTQLRDPVTVQLLDHAVVNSKLSLNAAEQRWVERNQCDPESRRELNRDEHGTCYTWDCATETQFCHIRGGHGWPGPNIDRVPTYDTRCAHEPAASRFPASDTIVAFIKTVLDQGQEEP